MVRSAGWPAAILRSMPSTRAGPAVKSSTIRISESRPLCTNCSRASGSAVSNPKIPNGARSNSTSFIAGSCGAWSVAIASTVPSTSPARSASRSSRAASGGFILNRESYVTSSSISVKWCGVTSQLTRKPRDFAQRTCSSDAFAERCATCNRAPVNSASCTSRAAQTDSAAAGIPRNPSRVEVTPSRITAPAASETSSACSITGRFSDRQYSITCRASLAVPIGFPSSETPTIPASFIAAISAIASPLLPTDAAPIGHTRTLPWAFVRSTINRVTDALSFTGFVFGIQQTAVNPPRAAARVPLSIVSEDSWPGSRRCAWRSINPGAITSPLASKISKPLVEESLPAGAISAMRSPSSKTSSDASVFRKGSTTRPFLTRSMRWVLYVRGAPIPRQLCFTSGMRLLFRVAGNQQEEQRHAHCDAIGHLIQYARLRSVGDLRRNLNAAIHRSRMQHNRIRFGSTKTLAIQLVQQNIIVRRKRRLVQSFRLYPEHKHNVRSVQRFFDIEYAPDRCSVRADLL